MENKKSKEQKDERLYIVYKHTNKYNGKVYIGITKRKAEERWLKDGKGYKGNQRFFNAIKHYSWDGFTHEILETGLTNKQAEDREKYYIALYKANDEAFGYNQNEGGSCPKHSQETKNKISKALKDGLTDERRLCFHYMGKEIYKKRLNGEYESIPKRIITDEIRNKLSKHSYSKKMAGENHFNCSPCLRLSDMKFYKTLEACFEDNDISMHTLQKHLSLKVVIPQFIYVVDFECLTKEQQDELILKQKYAQTYTYKYKKIVRTVDGTLFESIDTCVKYTFDSCKRILTSCKNLSKELPQEYMFQEDYEKLSEEQRIRLREDIIYFYKNHRQFNTGGIKVICLSNKRVFNNINICCKENNIQKENLMAICEKASLNEKYMFLLDYRLCYLQPLHYENPYSLSFKLKRHNTRKRAVIDLRTGKIYDSIKDCYKDVSEDIPSIIQQCKGKRLYQDFMYYDDYLALIVDDKLEKIYKSRYPNERYLKYNKLGE